MAEAALKKAIQLDPYYANPKTLLEEIKFEATPEVPTNAPLVSSPQDH